MKKFNSSDGVITVLVSLLLTGILSMGTLVIEAGRLQAAKTQLAEANISAATSMIAAYDQDLYERYGLLAIDTKRFTLDRAIEYLDFNSDLFTGYRGNNLTVMYDIDSVELVGMYNLTYPSIIKRQILSRAKYHIIPQDFSLNVDNIDGFFADFQSKCQYVYDKLGAAVSGSASSGSIDDIKPNVQEALKTLYETYKNLETADHNLGVTISQSSYSLLPSVTGTVENDAPSEDILDINSSLSDAMTVLGGQGSTLINSNGTATSEIDVSVDLSFTPYIINNLKDVVSSENIASDTVVISQKIRTAAQALISAMNTMKSDKDGSLMLNSYISQYFSNRKNRIQTYVSPTKGTNTTMDDGTFVSACAEYVFGGKASEEENQTVAYNYIQAIRFINNLYAVLNNSTDLKSNNLYSVAAHIAWANYESIIDMELYIKHNASVPFNKNQMLLNINSPDSVNSAFSTKDTDDALKNLGRFNGTEYVVSGAYSFSYKDMIAFALWFVPNSSKMLRVADLIQLEMRYRERYKENKGATFLMSNQNTYCRIKCTAKFNSVLPTISAGGTSGVVEFKSIKYAGY